jgi:hypothetical protein
MYVLMCEREGVCSCMSCVCDHVYVCTSVSSMNLYVKEVCMHVCMQACVCLCMCTFMCAVTKQLRGYVNFYR